MVSGVVLLFPIVIVAALAGAFVGPRATGLWLLGVGLVLLLYVLLQEVGLVALSYWPVVGVPVGFLCLASGVVIWLSTRRRK